MRVDKSNYLFIFKLKKLKPGKNVESLEFLRIVGRNAK